MEIRKILKTPVYKKNYDKSALVVSFYHSVDHKSMAHELFYNSGPLAILPMKKVKKNKFSSSLIWSHEKEFINNLFNSKKEISDFNFTEGIDNHDLTPIINENAVEDVNKYFGSPSWVTFGFNSSFAFNENWKLQGVISNLFDQHFREFASGISAPGRNFSFSLITVF